MWRGVWPLSVVSFGLMKISTKRSIHFKKRNFKQVYVMVCMYVCVWMWFQRKWSVQCASLTEELNYIEVIVIDSHVKWRPFVNVHYVDLLFKSNNNHHINKHQFQKQNKTKSKIFTSELLSRRIWTISRCPFFAA